jgi:radical SAM protein with 4Fe4S-binding SPASM domain
VESGLDRLIISVDGTTQEVYSQYRVGGRLDKVLEGAANIVKWKKALKSKTPYVFFQFLVVRPNEHQLEEARALAKKTGVDGIRFKTAQVYDYENDPNRLIPQQSTLTRCRKKPDGRYEPKNEMQNHCWRLWHSPVITWDGLVVPCCFDKDAQHRMGDLSKKPFKEIWHDAEYVRFRREVLQSRSNIDICANCSEGVKVWGD